MPGSSKKNKSARKIHWHPAFFQAIQRELADYKDALEFKYEHQLTTEPLRIDVLLINNLALKGRGCCSHKVFVFGV
ncbi:hypothetical protein [Treponema primitia]|uniref:hypothetical protein n=1 Tax=Treponema primitia TaxID=88058 RepID=UPI00059F8988|nr:hypothetical protein [Treponema primitia]